MKVTTGKLRRLLGSDQRACTGREAHRAAHRGRWPETDAPPGTVPLSAVPAGQTVELVAIESGHRLRRRLADLGLNPGVTLRVIQNGRGGPLLLAVRDDARLALGRGMAEQIFVKVHDASAEGHTQHGR